MKIIPVQVDGSQKEKMPYLDSTFPIDIWTDVYDTFIDETLNCHWHPDFELAVLVSGSLDFYVNGNHLPMESGDGIFINSNNMHIAKQRAECSGAVIKGVAFPLSLFVNNTSSIMYKKYFEPIVNSSVQGMVIPKESAFAKKMTHWILEIHKQVSEEFGSELMYLSILSQLWREHLTYVFETKSELLEHKINRRNEERAKKILSYIHENYSEPLTVEVLAEHANISRSECFRCFKHFTNKNPMEYIIEYRLGNAAKLLMESRLSVTEVGIACGFNSSSYFGKIFKETYGVSPKQYRQ